MRTAERLRELVGTDGLGDVVVHSGREARFAILGQRVRRHGDDAGPLLRRPALADPARGVETVELGHLHVHQHHVVRPAFERLQSLETIPRHVGAIAELVEQPERHLLVHGVVLGQEDPQRRRRELLVSLRGLGGLHLGVRSERFQQRVVELRRLHRLRELHRERPR